MSNINYDITYPVVYDSSYKHYIARYRVYSRAYKVTKTGSHTVHGREIYDYESTFEASVSFDDGNEFTASGSLKFDGSGYAYDDPNPPIWYTIPVTTAGPFNTVYIRNPHPDTVNFLYSDTLFGITYSTKAEFKIQFNSVGFAANQNASFRCSTVQQNTFAQYEWVSAEVHYKKTTESTYQIIPATVSGTWSDVTVSTTFGFDDGFTYDIYITATADDGTTSSTTVEQFTTTDAEAVATCIYPVGAFVDGEVKFAWAHSTEYGTPQKAYDLRYSSDNGGTWTDLASHNVTTISTHSATIDSAGSYIWQVRTYNTNDVVGEWAQAAFVNNVPAVPPTNLISTTTGRPEVSWTVASQSAYQVQVLFGDSIEYDSGAMYSAQRTHIVNKYLYDARAYTIRVRIYDALGNVSDWSSVSYQQPNIPDVVFVVEQDANGGADIILTENSEFVKYYVLRNGIPIGIVENALYYDRYAIGDVNYSIVGVTATDNSDIKSVGIKAVYPKATIVTLDGNTYAINKRFNSAYEIQTASQKRYRQAQFIGDTRPSYYSDEMLVKSFVVTCFDENKELEKLLGTTVFYADNFGNGGYCFVSGYSKSDDYLQLSNKTYANEVSLTLEVTNYDDSIEYSL